MCEKHSSMEQKIRSDNVYFISRSKTDHFTFPFQIVPIIHFLRSDRRKSWPRWGGDRGPKYGGPSKKSDDICRSKQWPEAAGQHSSVPRKTFQVIIWKGLGTLTKALGG